MARKSSSGSRAVTSSEFQHDHCRALAANSTNMNASKRFGNASVQGAKGPKSDEDLDFTSVLELAQLIKRKQIISKELTGIFIKRLKRYDRVLKSVVTITKELAYKQAKEADDLLAKSEYLGNHPICLLPS